MALQSIILNKPSLAWYISDPSKLSDESVVEHVLQYGDWNDVQALFSEKPISEIAQIFTKTTQKTRSNYSPQIEHFFKLYFANHV